MTARQDFTIDAGRDWELTVALTEEDGTTPLDLTDCSLAWAASKASGQTALIAKSTSDSSQIHITDIAGGLAVIFVLQTDTETLGGLTCEHELVVTDAAERESTMLRGLITITKTLIA